MPRIHETISGHRIEYPDPSRRVERFLQRVQEIVDDNQATEDELVALVYSKENPILDATIFPERGAVTREVLNDPVYQVLTDQLFRKRVQQEEIDIEKLARRYTLTVKEAAARRGVHVSAIRQAIQARRLPSWVKGGQYYLECKSLDALTFGTRGPKRAAS